jgi:diketogulonate reductase-like aldo/keto reductase
MKTATFLLFHALLLLILPATTQGKNSLYNGFTKKKEGLIDDVPTIKLSNDREFPLVGLGVGNLQANRVENMIYEGLKSEHRIRMIDTAHASNNERSVARGITTGVKRFMDDTTTIKEVMGDNDRVQVHVVTKVWYTYLGYVRTKMSVLQSLEELGEAMRDVNVDLKVHILIHWPRCHDGIEWMKCEEEENNLPENIRRLPAPHLNKENAWKESWKALEDMYQSGDYPALAGIGVSNFGIDDMEALIQMARVPPHIIQMNVWSLLNDPKLVETCNRNNVHIQVFNVMNGILGSIFNTPHAHHHLLMVASDLKKAMPEELASGVTASQVILKWLIQFGLSIIPRTSNLDRLAENSAVKLAAIPDLDDKHLELVAHAVEAMLSGNDLDEDVYVTVTFHAKNQDMFLYFFMGEDKETQLSYIAKGDSFVEKTHPHHSFRLYNAYNPDVYHTYTVEGTYGEHQEIHVEL